MVGVGNTQELDLGIVVKYVLNSVSYYLDQINYISKLKNKLESIPAMTTDEVKQVRINEKQLELNYAKFFFWILFTYNLTLPAFVEGY